MAVTIDGVLIGAALPAVGYLMKAFTDHWLIKSRVTEESRQQALEEVTETCLSIPVVMLELVNTSGHVNDVFPLLNRAKVSRVRSLIATYFKAQSGEAAVLASQFLDFQRAYTDVVGSTNDRNWNDGEIQKVNESFKGTNKSIYRLLNGLHGDDFVGKELLTMSLTKVKNGDKPSKDEKG